MVNTFSDWLFNVILWGAIVALVVLVYETFLARGFLMSQVDHDQGRHRLWRGRAGVDLLAQVLASRIPGLVTQRGSLLQAAIRLAGASVKSCSIRKSLTGSQDLSFR